MQSSFPAPPAAPCRRWAALFLALVIGPAAFAQTYNPDIDVRHYIFGITVNDANDKIQGNARIDLVFRQTVKDFHLDLNAKNANGTGMTVLHISEEGRTVTWTQDSDRLLVHAGGAAGEKHSYLISYDGIPADGLIIANNKYGHRGFFGDNWPNRAHNWLPCVDHPSDKADLEWIIIAPDHYKVVANGTLQEEKPLPGSNKLTRWKESAPLSPKVMVIGIADFAVGHPGDTLGIPVWNYVYKEDSAIGLRSYASALNILPFYISHIGPYPFEKCGNVQSKTRFGGLENASAIFYYENSVSSAGIESLMAHEIAHQWFGDAASETEWKHLWLSEGFATYMTHCYLEYKYGPDTLRTGMNKDREQVLAFEKRRMTAIVDTTIHNDYMQLLNPNSYQKGGWVLHMLRRRLGDSLFWKGISTYYSAFRDQNASSADLEKVMETVSGQDLHAFFHQWLHRPGHPRLDIYRIVKDDKLTGLKIVQQQEQPYLLQLQYTIDGLAHTADIKEKTTIIPLPPAPANTAIVYDPYANLLAEIREMKTP